jgi:hypothetical protein
MGAGSSESPEPAEPDSEPVETLEDAAANEPE